MKSKFLIIPALMANVIFAQGPGPRGFGGTSGAPHTFTPPTAQQLAAAQLSNIARYLRLDSTDTSKLVGDNVLIAAVEALQKTQQANATALSAAYAALAADLAPGGKASDVSTQEGIINGSNASNLTAGITAVQAVLPELAHDGFTISATQASGIARLLIGGGFGSFGGPAAHFRGAPAGN